MTTIDKIPTSKKKKGKTNKTVLCISSSSKEDGMYSGLVRFSSQEMHRQDEHLTKIIYQKQISKVLGDF